MSETVKNVLALILLLALGGGAYYIYTTQGSAGFNLDAFSLSRDGSALSVNLEQESQAFVSRLRTLEQVEIKTDLFDDSRFTSLRSYTTPPPELEVGRENPFQSVLLD